MRDPGWTVGRLTDELADVVIRTFDLAGALVGGERFAETVESKMLANLTRPHKHRRNF